MEKNVKIVFGAVFLSILFIWGIIARGGGIKGYESYTTPVSLTLLFIVAILLYFKKSGEKKK